MEFNYKIVTAFLAATGFGFGLYSFIGVHVLRSEIDFLTFQVKMNDQYIDMMIQANEKRFEALKEEQKNFVVKKNL